MSYAEPESDSMFALRAVVLLTLAISAFVWMAVTRSPTGQGANGMLRRSTPASAAINRTAPAELEPFFREASLHTGVSIALLRAVAYVESRMNPQARSAAGAQGVMQLMPRTAQAMGVMDSYDARENILGGARYLRWLAERWNDDPVLTLASYNAGPRAVQKYGGIPPFAETQRYVGRVLRRCVDPSFLASAVEQTGGRVVRMQDAQERGVTLPSAVAQSCVVREVRRTAAEVIQVKRGARLSASKVWEELL